MGLLVRTLKSGIRSTEVEKNMLAHLKSFFWIWETIATSSSVIVFLRSEMFSCVFIECLRIRSPGLLHQCAIVSRHWWCWCVMDILARLGRGWCFLPSMFPTSNFSVLYAHLLICQLSYLSRQLLYFINTRLCKQEKWIWSNLKMPCRK